MWSQRQAETGKSEGAGTMETRSDDAYVARGRKAPAKERGWPLEAGKEGKGLPPEGLWPRETYVGTLANTTIK